MTVASTTRPFARGDRWLLWPVVASIAGTTVLTFLCGLPGLVSFVLIPFSLLAYAVAAVAIVVSAVVVAARRRLRKSSSLLLALAAPVLLWPPINWITIYLHLGLTAGFGMGTIGPTPEPGAPFAVYDWSTGLAGGPVTFLIHDETDEIALPPASHKHPISLENGFGEDCAGKAAHLLGHYYLCTF